MGDRITALQQLVSPFGKVRELLIKKKTSSMILFSNISFVDDHDFLRVFMIYEKAERKKKKKMMMASVIVLMLFIDLRFLKIVLLCCVCVRLIQRQCSLKPLNISNSSMNK